MKRICNDRTRQERRRGPTTVGGGGGGWGTGGCLQRRLIDMRSRSAAGGPLLEFEGPELHAPPRREDKHTCSGM